MSNVDHTPSLKRCTKCGNEYPATLDYFFKRSNRKSGLESSCKKCRTKQITEYQRTPKGQEVAARAVKKYYLSDHGRKKYAERHKQYMSSDVGKKNLHRYRQQAQNIQQRKAHAKVRDAIKAGRIPRADTLICNRCGSQARDYHHWSYLPEHWLDVEPLCRNCHLKHHEKSS